VDTRSGGDQTYEAAFKRVPADHRRFQESPVQDQKQDGKYQKTKHEDISHPLTPTWRYRKPEQGMRRPDKEEGLGSQNVAVNPGRLENRQGGGKGGAKVNQISTVGGGGSSRTKVENRVLTALPTSNGCVKDRPPGIG